MSKKHKHYRASNQREMQAAPQPAPATTEPCQLRGRARMDWIEARTQEIFDAQGGSTYDLLLRTGQATLRAFESQMADAENGTDKGWGPDISIYESRMTRALTERVLRERRAALREIRQRIERALDDELASLTEQSEGDEADQTPPAPRKIEASLPGQPTQPSAPAEPKSAPDYWRAAQAFVAEPAGRRQEAVAVGEAS